MHFRFNFEKCLQAAGVLLRLEEGRMSYMRLLKLLYVADREMLASTASPLTGDQAYAMRFGPVLSRTYSLIKETDFRFGEWSRFLQTQGYAIKLVADPGRGRLSKGEIEKLTEISERYRLKDQWELSDLTHDFPEWKRHWPDTADNGSYPIPWEDMLLAQTEGEDVARIVEQEEKCRIYMDKIFGSKS
jgi:uncharacterized phage-associated protein